MGDEPRRTEALPQERGLRIRQYRPADRDAVIALFRAFMRELTPPHLEREFAAYVALAIRDELSRIEDYYLKFWVAAEDGLVGMVGVERHGDGSAELRRMAVHEAHRRRGLGRALLKTAEDFCRSAGYRTLILSTSELQSAARRLYESSGYRLVREEANPPATHKAVGAGVKRYHYEKVL